MTVSIYLLRSPHGVETYVWSCPTCLARRRALGWEVLDTRVPVSRLLCDDCELAEESRP